MENCSLLEVKDLLIALFTPLLQWFTREIMGRISEDSANDFIEAIVTGLGVLWVVFLMACFVLS